MTAILRQFTAMRETGVLGQLVRFGIVGGISTLVYAAVYLPLVAWVMPEGWAVGAVPFAFAVAVAVGFPLHSLWSFKGHGTRTPGGGQQMKFVVVQGAGLVMNMAFTWVLVDLGGLADWAPLVPAVTVIPLVTFLINRHWVFG
ncbi:GtrA family protein [Stakelama flava]